MVPPNRWPLQIFQAFEVFRLFDDDLPIPPPPSSTPSYSTTIGVTLVDESVDELVPSIEVSVEGVLGNKPPGNRYRFLMVRSLRPQTHSQRLPSFLRINNIGAPTDDLEGHLDRMIVDTGALG